MSRTLRPLGTDDYEAIAKGLDKIFNGDVPKGERTTGFCLLVFGFDAPGVANYISNGAPRADMIAALRETADRLERGEDNPK